MKACAIAIICLETIYGSNIDDYLSRNGLDSVQAFADLMYKEGVASIIGGVITAVVLLLCIKRRYWKVAFVLCVAASFELLVPLAFMPSQMVASEALTAVLQTGVGLLVARGIYINRKAFR